jgi:hypothetical protein
MYLYFDQDNIHNTFSSFYLFTNMNFKAVSNNEYPHIFTLYTELVCWICLNEMYLFLFRGNHQYMYMPNVCSLKTIYTKYSNSTTNLKNIVMPVKHTRTMQHIETYCIHCLKPILLSSHIHCIWFPLNKNKYISLRQIQHTSSVYKVHMWRYSLFETDLKSMFVNS